MHVYLSISLLIFDFSVPEILPFFVFVFLLVSLVQLSGIFLSDLEVKLKLLALIFLMSYHEEFREDLLAVLGILSQDMLQKLKATQIHTIHQQTGGSFQVFSISKEVDIFKREVIVLWLAI